MTQCPTLLLTFTLIRNSSTCCKTDSSSIRDAEKGAYSSVYVQGLSEYRVRSEEEVLSLLLKGLRNRATRATEMNNESSRSHTILQLFVQVRQVESSHVT
jgi:hypothetical protein